MVQKYVRLGCPTKSLKAADNWKKVRAQKREPTDGKSAMLRSVGKRRGRPEKLREPSNTGDQLLDALNDAVAVAHGAFRAYQYALVNNLPTQSARLSENNKAIDIRFKAERAYREELERRNQLIAFSQATEMFRRGFDFLLTRMKRIPQSQAPRCNPSNPTLAFGILESAVNILIEETQKEYAA